MSSSKVVFDVVAVTGTYKNQDGETKSRTMKCGVVMENDKGMSMKLEALPVGAGWDGWLRFYEPKPKEQRQPGGAPRRGNAAPDDDVPF